MEFWGVEIKSGETIVVEKEGDKMLHLSQACLGEVKKNKGTEPVYLFAKVGDQKHVIGILSLEKTPQISFDLVFEKKFELSHNWKNGTVHFLGYRGSEGQYDEESDSEDDMVPIPIDPGTSNSQAKKEVKGAGLNNAIKSNVKASTDNDEKDSSSTDESTEESSDDEQAKVKNEEESSDDELETDEESDDSEEDNKEVEEKKVDTSKKRPAEAATKTSAADKKAKLVTPEKSGASTSGNKVVHVATPYPTKQTGKIAAKPKSDQPKQQTPKPTGAFACKSCNKSFGSDVALQSHTKAKHATGN